MSRFKTYLKSNNYIYVGFFLFVAIVFFVPIDRGTPLSGEVTPYSGVYEQSSPVDGELMAVAVVRGQKVNNGDRLFQVKTTDFQPVYEKKRQAFFFNAYEFELLGGCRVDEQLCKKNSTVPIAVKKSVRELVGNKLNLLAEKKKLVDQLRVKIDAMPSLVSEGLIANVVFLDAQREYESHFSSYTQLKMEIDNRIEALRQDLNSDNKFFAGFTNIDEDGWVKAELSGIVHDIPQRDKLSYITKGKPAVSIVTDQMDLGIKAQLPVKYKKYVNIGDKVIARIISTGGIKAAVPFNGKIISISAEPAAASDITASGQNQSSSAASLMMGPTFRVYIKPDVSLKEHAIGTQAQVLVPMGEHTIAEYVIRPMRELLVNSFKVQ